MKVYTKLCQFPKYNPNEPFALTIGTFDGVHLGHQDLLHRIVQIKNHCVITFRTPPSYFLQKQDKGLIITLEHKLLLLKKFGVSSVYLMDFTTDLASKSAEEFLSELRDHLPFSHLYLGYDASIGHNRSGTPEIIHQLAKKMHFFLDYLSPYKVDQQVISSSLIRQVMHQANFSHLKNLLGREYSIASKIVSGHGMGRKIGYPTLNIPVDHLITPPLGVWICETSIQGKTFPSLANLGTAPTLHEKRALLLEVHLFSEILQIPDAIIEVTFKKFLRSEKKFSDLESLKKQIHIDTEIAKQYFRNTLQT